MWLLTVVSLTTSWLAISALDSPWAISVSTSASRAVSPAGNSRRGSAGAGWPRAAAMTSSRCCWTAGSMAAWPLVTCCECVADLGGAGVLGQVAAGAGAERFDDGAVVGVGGQHEYLDARRRGRGGDAWLRRRRSGASAGPSAPRLGEAGWPLPVPRCRRLRCRRPRRRRAARAGWRVLRGRPSGHRRPGPGWSGHAGTQSSTRNPLPWRPAVSVPPSSSARSPCR